MGVDRTGLVGLGTPNDDAFSGLGHNVHKDIWIGLLVRRQTAVALGVCHGPIAGQIVFLDIGQVF